MNAAELRDRYRWINAVHESGHAVASLALGNHVFYACVDNDNPLDSAFGHVMRSPQGNDTDVTAFLSGMAAEIIERSDGSSFSMLQKGVGSGDWLNIQRYMKAKNHTASERRSIIKLCKVRSLEILKANWPAVLRTARALVATGYVEGDKLQALFSEGEKQ
jgi:hypothetical protein